MGPFDPSRGDRSEVTLENGSTSALRLQRDLSHLVQIYSNPSGTFSELCLGIVFF